MSAQSFDQAYFIPRDQWQIDARPLGGAAAIAMGVLALFTLIIAVVLDKSQSPNMATNAPTPLTSPRPTTPMAHPVGLSSAPVAAFELDAPELSKEKKNFSSRSLDGAGGREDSLTFGQFASANPYLRLDFRMLSGEKRANADFFLDLTRHAAQAGLSVVKIGNPSPLATRFGGFDVADMRVTSEAGAASERACLAMRLSDGKQPLDIAGIACGAGPKPIDRRALGCILDGLKYNPSGGDDSVAQFFAAADKARAKGCGVAASADTEKTNFFEANSAAPTPVKIAPQPVNLAPTHAKLAPKPAQIARKPAHLAPMHAKLAPASAKHTKEAH